MSKVSYKRHLAKTFTWRAIGTFDTILLSWFLSGNPFIGLKIGFSEMITKMILYYLHERIWVTIKVAKSQRRHLLKTISWRIIGTLDTILLSWIFTQDFILSFKIGTLEILTKMALYYLHERTWYSINYGLNER